MFRNAVAVAAKKQYGYEPDYSIHPYRAYMGWWDPPNIVDDYRSDAIKEGFHPYGDPLDVFFVHSDCEGWIFPEDAGPLADRLEGLTDLLGDWNKSLKRFVAGLRKAEQAWEIVRFH